MAPRQRRGPKGGNKAPAQSPTSSVTKEPKVQTSAVSGPKPGAASAEYRQRLQQRRGGAATILTNAIRAGLKRWLPNLVIISLGSWFAFAPLSAKDFMTASIFLIMTHTPLLMMTALILAVYTIFWLNHIYRDGSRKLPNPVAIVPLVIMLIVMLLAMLPHNHSAVLTHVQNAFSEQECRWIIHSMAQAEREGVMNEYYAAPDHNSTLRLVPLEEAVEKPPAWLASIIYFIMSCMNGHRSSTHATEDMIISKHRTPVVKERVNELMADRLQPLIDKYYASQYAYTINYAGVPAFIADAAQSGSLLSAATSATSSVSSPSSSPLFDYTTEPAGGEDRTLEIKIDDMHMMRFQGERRKKKKSNKKDSKDRIDGTGMRTDKGLLTLYIALDSLATYSGGAIVLDEVSRQKLMSGADQSNTAAAAVEALIAANLERKSDASNEKETESSVSETSGTEGSNNSENTGVERNEAEMSQSLLPPIVLARGDALIVPAMMRKKIEPVVTGRNHILVVHMHVTDNMQAVSLSGVCARTYTYQRLAMEDTHTNDDERFTISKKKKQQNKKQN